MNSVVEKNTNRKLDVHEILTWLEGDGMVVADNAHMVRMLAGGKAFKDKHPLEIIAERHWIDEKTSRPLTLDVLTGWFARRVGLPYLRIDPLKVDVTQVTEVMSFAYAQRFNVLAVKVEAHSITLATAQPFDHDWEDEISRLHNKELKLVIASPEEISRYLVEFYTVSKSVFGAKNESQRGLDGLQNLESLMELGRSGKLDANDQHVVNIVDWLFQYAFEQRASDIHLEPRREMSNVRFRIDGIMHEVYQIPTTVMAEVSSRIKILGRMDVAEKRRPQDGRLKTRSPDGQEIELRLSTMPTAFGEKMVMRIFDPEVLVRNFQQLGFSSKDDEMWQSMIHQPNGIILVTGPTGSGKTTTLYSSLKQLAKPDVNVCTIEDPIELVEPAFNQMQVQKNIDLDFSSGVKTLLRQDPDIIMIGEIRDMETAEMAIQAALTGHLVLSTLHTNDAPSTITRLTEMGIEPYLVSSTVLGVVAQRLVRKICPDCRTEAKDIAPDVYRLLKIRKNEVFYHGKGCATCNNSGFHGRTTIVELLMISPEMIELINKHAPEDQLRKLAIKQGMQTLTENGIELARRGITTLEEVFAIRLE